jgi:hypothetical protein
VTRFFFVAAALLGLGGPLTGCLYTDVRAPLSYGSATPSDAGGALGREVTGSSCNTAILWLFAFGNGGYDAAVKDALAGSNAPFLVDVRADTSYKNVLLGLYQRQCTNVTARLPGGPAAAAASAASLP